MPNRALLSSSAAKISNFEPLHDSFQKNQKKRKKEKRKKEKRKKEPLIQRLV